MSQKVFDIDGVMTRLDNDRELLFELFDIFLPDSEVQLSAIEEAIATSSPKALQESAHAIKGALGNIGAMLAHTYAFQLEAAGRAGDLTAANKLLTDLRQAISGFIVELEQYRSTT